MSSAPVTAECIVNAPVSKAWQAFTDKDQMKEWYFEMDKFQPTPGFEFQFWGETEDKTRFLHLCKIVEADPEKKLSHTWRYENIPGDTLVTIDFIKLDENRTHVKLKHEGLENFPKDNPNLKKENFQAGWNEIIGKMLPEYLAGK